jgi:hypothetical protein
MPWREMANISGMCGTLTRGFLAAFAAVPLGRSLINKKCCLRFLGPVLASLHGAPTLGLNRDHKDGGDSLRKNRLAVVALRRLWTRRPWAEVGGPL